MAATDLTDTPVAHRRTARPLWLVLAGLFALVGVLATDADPAVDVRAGGVDIIQDGPTRTERASRTTTQDVAPEPAPAPSPEAEHPTPPPPRTWTPRPTARAVDPRAPPAPLHT